MFWNEERDREHRYRPAESPTCSSDWVWEGGEALAEVREEMGDEGCSFFGEGWTLVCYRIWDFGLWLFVDLHSVP